MNHRPARFVAVLVTIVYLIPGSVLADGMTDASLMLGYRQDSLDWNIKGNTGPNILSQLTWRDLKTYQIRGDVISVNDQSFYFRGSASYGWIQSGENQDSDYAGNNRTLEFSRSVNDVDGSKLMDFKGGVGIQIPFGDRNRHHVVPLIFGLSYNSQQLKMTDGRQVVSNLANAQIYNPGIASLPPVGPISGLNSSYDATWLGVWLGLDIDFDLKDMGTVTFRLENHRSDFNAKANWNLRDDFDHPVSFEHEANGRGLVLELGWQSPFKQQNWQWGVNLGWQRWTTEPGTDRTYVTYYYDNIGNLVVCTPYCIGAARLNEVNWSSSHLNITISREIQL